MYLVLSWKKTLYWISLDISKLFCKTLLFTRKKKDKLEEAIFKSPQIQTRSKVFFFRLEKKPERRKKKHFGLFPSASQSSPPPPAARHQFRKLHGARGHARKKEGNARLSRARREVILFPSGETHHRLFFSIRGESIGLLPLPFPIFLPSPAPQESRNERSRFVSRRRHASNVSCIKIILILVFEGGEEWEILAFSRAYIYIYTLLCGFYRRERNVDILRSSKESLPLSLSMGGGDLLVWFFLYRRNTTQRAVLFLHRITGTALNSRVSWEFGCIGAARVLAVTSLSFSIFLKGIDGGWNFSDWSGSWT